MATVELIKLLGQRGYRAGDTLTFKQVGKFLLRAGVVKQDMPSIAEAAERLGLLAFEEGSRLRLL